MLLFSILRLFWRSACTKIVSKFSENYSFWGEIDNFISGKSLNFIFSAKKAKNVEQSEIHVGWILKQVADPQVPVYICVRYLD